jgi:hypothetical protein
MRYVPRYPPQPAVVDAAQYVHGLPFDDVLAVARLADPAARATVVDEWRLLVVRTEVNGVEEYEPVADGEWLAYRADMEYLFTIHGDAFAGEYEAAGC